MMDPTSTPKVKYKTVIADLTSLGYSLIKEDPEEQIKPGFETWNISYSKRMDVLIDIIGWPNQGTKLGCVWLPILYNKGNPDDPKHPGDTNPNKVPLRDIILSFWQWTTGRSVRELSSFTYGQVEETSTVAAVSKAYEVMGLTFDHGESFYNCSEKKGEKEAFEALSKCTFARGLSKLSLEYAEFKDRRIKCFEILFTVDSEGKEDPAYGWDLTIHLSL